MKYRMQSINNRYIPFWKRIRKKKTLPLAPFWELWASMFAHGDALRLRLSSVLSTPCCSYKSLETGTTNRPKLDCRSRPRRRVRSRLYILNLVTICAFQNHRLVGNDGGSWNRGTFGRCSGCFRDDVYLPEGATPVVVVVIVYYNT